MQYGYNSNILNVIKIEGVFLNISSQLPQQLKNLRYMRIPEI